MENTSDNQKENGTNNNTENNQVGPFSSNLNSIYDSYLANIKSTISASATSLVLNIQAICEMIDTDYFHKVSYAPNDWHIELGTDNNLPINKFGYMWKISTQEDFFVFYKACEIMEHNGLQFKKSTSEYNVAHKYLKIYQ